MNSFTVLNPEQLAPVRNLNLRAKLIVEGTIAGLHKSPFHGFSSEFLEYRPYLQGEPASKIDWRKFAKSDKTVVRLFEDETNLSAHIFLDKSASMAFGTGPMSKFEYARTLAASFAWILVRQKDAVGLAAFDEEVRTYLPPRSTNVQLKNILTVLEGAKPETQTRCGEVINHVASMLNKRGMSIILSDLFDDPEQIIMGLKHLRFKRQDTMVVCVADPFELNFDGKSVYKMKDLETGREVTLDPETAAEFFRQGLSEHHSRLEAAARELKIDFVVVTTAQPFHRSLLRVMEKRRRLL
ncbi:MAG: DUF58 domain-containing protein [Chitinispirillaceae bacterium]